MSDARSETFQAAAGGLGPLRLLVGTIAILFLVALASLDVGTSSRYAGTAVSDEETVSAPVFDGRGKWSGY